MASKKVVATRILAVVLSVTVCAEFVVPAYAQGNPTDAAMPTDAGRPVDAAAPGDAGGAGDAAPYSGSSSTTGSSGCSCHVGTAPSIDASFVALAALLVLGTRRARRVGARLR